MEEKNLLEKRKSLELMNNLRNAITEYSTYTGAFPGNIGVEWCNLFNSSHGYKKLESISCDVTFKDIEIY